MSKCHRILLSEQWKILINSVAYSEFGGICWLQLSVIRGEFVMCV